MLLISSQLYVCPVICCATHTNIMRILVWFSNKRIGICWLKSTNPFLIRFCRLSNRNVGQMFALHSAKSNIKLSSVWRYAKMFHLKRGKVRVKFLRVDTKTRKNFLIANLLNFDITKKKCCSPGTTNLMWQRIHSCCSNNTRISEVNASLLGDLTVFVHRESQNVEIIRTKHSGSPLQNDGMQNSIACNRNSDICWKRWI